MPSKRRVSDEAPMLEVHSRQVELGTHETARGRWSTTFLVVGSALLGATAIAFWNRRTIATMRAQILANSASAIPPRPSEDEIF
jgi:hypothetical protein